MTRQLYLLRHAKSSWDEPGLGDHDRPLAKRGRKAGAMLRDVFRAEAIRPDLALVSSAMRTRETFVALDLDPSPPVKILPALYHAEPDAILDIVRAAPEAARALLVVGHNPGLQDFAVQLANETNSALVRSLADSFPTGALAQFELDRPWAQLAAGCGRLTRFVTPRTLKAARGD
jgi:phosphohistidine phosphatase